MAAAKSQQEPQAGRLVNQQARDVVMSLSSAVFQMATAFAGAAGEEARAKAGPFLVRLMRTLPNLVAAWSGIHVLPDTAADAIIPDHRADFSEVCADIERHIIDLMQCALEIQKGNPLHARVMSALGGVEETSLALMGMVVNHRFSFDGFRNDEQPPLVFRQVATADFLAHSFARITAYAVSLRIGLSRLQSGGSEVRAMDDAERARRYRARKRRRVAFQATIDVYDDDLALLRQFGFLLPTESEDQEVATKELEAFLLHAFLTYPHSPRPWRERITKQSGRISSLRGRDGESRDE